MAKQYHHYLKLEPQRNNEINENEYEMHSLRLHHTLVYACAIHLFLLLVALCISIGLRAEHHMDHGFENEILPVELYRKNEWMLIDAVYSRYSFSRQFSSDPHICHPDLIVVTDMRRWSWINFSSIKHHRDRIWEYHAWNYLNDVGNEHAICVSAQLKRVYPCSMLVATICARKSASQ